MIKPILREILADGKRAIISLSTLPDSILSRYTSYLNASCVSYQNIRPLTIYDLYSFRKEDGYSNIVCTNTFELIEGAIGPIIVFTPVSIAEIAVGGMSFYLLKQTKDPPKWWFKRMEYKQTWWVLPHGGAK